MNLQVDFSVRYQSYLNWFIYATIVKRLSLTLRSFLRYLTDGGRAFFHPYSLFKIWCICPAKKKLGMALHASKDTLTKMIFFHQKICSLRISSVNVTKSAVTFTEEIFNGKLHILCSDVLISWYTVMVSQTSEYL